MRLVRVFGVLCGLLLALPAPVAAAAPADFGTFAVPGHWYSETNGVPQSHLLGYAVLDTADSHFWSAFQRLGGVPVLGYPVSERYFRDGFLTQAFQKVILQWHPGSGRVAFVNVFDLLHSAGKDALLQAARQIPPPLDTASDTGKTWAQVVAAHQALLAGNAAIDAAYRADPDALDHYGLPLTTPVDEGDVIVVRTQRAVFQQWKQAMPWAAAGQVTIANGGDIAKEEGLVPAAAQGPFLPNIAYLPGGPYRHDAWDVAVRLEDLPPGFQTSGSQGMAGPAPGASAPLSPGAQEFLQQEAHGLVNGNSPEFALQAGLATAAGPIVVVGATDVFASAAGAAWDYGELVRILSSHSHVQPATVLPIGDATTGLVGQLTLADGRVVPAYSVIFQAGNVAVGTTVAYGQGPGSFDLVTALAQAVYQRIVTPPA